MAEEEKNLELSQHYRVTIQRINNQEEREAGLLVGAISKEHLLVTGVPAGIYKPGERIILRTVRGGKAYGFETTVTDVVESPVTVLFLVPPANIEAIGLRKADRLNVFIPTDLRSKAAGDESSNTMLLKATILNLGPGGCRVFTRTKIPQNASVNLSFSLPGEKTTLVVGGAVLDTFTTKSVFGQRIKFHNVENYQNDLAEIRKWISANQVFIET